MKSPERDAYSYRSDSNVPSFPDERPIIIFDGKCVFCSKFAQFVLRNDPQGQFRLMAAQTPLGASIYRHYGLNPVDYETNILLENGRAWFKSEGTIRMFVRLGFPWSIAAVLKAIPTSILNRVYEVVARNRLRWFGASEECFVPTDRYADRFL